jgi:hypothetical protein
MKDLVGFEYRKIWNKVTIFAVIVLFVLTTLVIFIYMDGQYRTIDQNGKIVSGLQSHRVLKEASKYLNGTLDEKYIQNLIKDYNSSFDKKYMEEHRGYLGTAGMTKYMVPNYLINYAYYGPYMSTGNDKIGLDYEFLDSEESFYKKYKESVKEHLLLVNEWNGLFPYSEEQINVLEEKIENIRTPFRIESYQGLATLRSWFRMEYSIFFVVLAFALSGMYAKDSTSGISELTLSTAYGRKKNMKARWIAGNLFTITAYLLFVGTLILENGAIASLHGWNASIQTSMYECLYNINVGTGLFIVFAGGLLGSLVMANFVMLISMKTRNTKLTTIVSLIAVWVLVKLSATYSQIKLFNPMQFKSDSLLTEYIFIGNIAIPYFLVVLALTCIYVAVLQLFIRQSYNKYYLH